MFKTYRGQMIFTIIATFLVTAILFGGGDSKSADSGKSAPPAVNSSAAGQDVGSSTDTTKPSETAPTVDNTLGKYTMDILSCRFGHDFEGKDVIYITYEFTNNADDAASFEWTFDHHAYQNGIELEKALFLDDDDNYDLALGNAEIKTGVSLQLERAYVLRDSSPVETEVSELISFSDKKISKTFEIE